MQISNSFRKLKKLESYEIKADLKDIENKNGDEIIVTYSGMTTLPRYVLDDIPITVEAGGIKLVTSQWEYLNQFKKLNIYKQDKKNNLIFLFFK
jgi:hypothetical protein